MFRAAFTADEGHVLVAADYSQVGGPGNLSLWLCQPGITMDSHACWTSALSRVVCHEPHACSRARLRMSLFWGVLSRLVPLVQAELRVMAALSGDEALLQAFAAGQDVHAATARDVLGKGPQVGCIGWWAGLVVLVGQLHSCSAPAGPSSTAACKVYPVRKCHSVELPQCAPTSH
jgi:hypothetical protein